jgi:hypothetical protein
LRRLAGQACKARAEELFKEERMLRDYVELIEQAFISDVRSHSLSMTPKFQKQIQQVDDLIEYYYLVWKAWEACDRGDMSEMVDNLRSAWACTPYFTTETILDWVKNFIIFASEKGVTLDTNELINSRSWQQVIESIQGFEIFATETRKFSTPNS